MQKIIYKITQIVLNFQILLHKKRIEKLHKKFSSPKNSKILTNDIELNFNIQNEEKKIEINNKVKNIINKSENNPEKILNIIKENGTDVFKINNANIFLKLIGEEEGFIPPLKGINAFFLNIFVNFNTQKKLILSLKSNEMFILRPLSIDIYYMIHQLYYWCAYKYGLSGFELQNRKKFKNLLAKMNEKDITNLSLDDILEMKEAIKRDVEAIDFVVNLAKESEASTKLLNKIKNGQSVKL